MTVSPTSLIHHFILPKHSTTRISSTHSSQVCDAERTVGCRDAYRLTDNCGMIIKLPISLGVDLVLLLIGTAKQLQSLIAYLQVALVLIFILLEFREHRTGLRSGQCQDEYFGCPYSVRRNQIWNL